MAQFTAWRQFPRCSAEPGTEVEPCGFAELRRQRLELLKAEVATLCRQRTARIKPYTERTLEICKEVLSGLWLSTDSCCMRKNLRPRKKISLDSFLMNLNNSQSSDKAPAAVERLHNAGGTGWSLLREHALAARIG